MFDFKKIDIIFYASHFQTKFAFKKFYISIKKCFGKYIIKYVYNFSNDTEIRKKIYIKKIEFNNIFKKFYQFDFNTIDDYFLELCLMRDGSVTSFEINKNFKTNIYNIILLEYYWKENELMKYLYNCVIELLDMEDTKTKNYWYI